MIITSYLSGTTDKPLRVQVTNADGTKQACDIKDVSQYSDALVLNVNTDFFFKEIKTRKFQEGQFVICKSSDEDEVPMPHMVIQVDENENKYRLDNGSVIHFSEEDDYKPTVLVSTEVRKKYYNIALEHILDSIPDKDSFSRSEILEIFKRLRK